MSKKGKDTDTIANCLYFCEPAPFADLVEKKLVDTFVVAVEAELGKMYYKQYDYKPFTSGDRLAVITIMSLSIMQKCPTSHFIMAGQPHEDQISVIDEALLHLPVEKQIERLAKSDAMITNQPNYFLCVRTADCLPVMFYDPVNKAIGIAHCGWRSTVKRLASATVRRMAEEYGTVAASLQVAFAPCISMRHYEVGEDVFVNFINEDFNPFTIFQDFVNVDHEGYVYIAPHLSLQSAVLQDLMSAGVKDENVRRTVQCTCDNKQLFSVRRDGQCTGRILSGIKL